MQRDSRPSVPSSLQKLKNNFATLHSMLCFYAFMLMLPETIVPGSFHCRLRVFYSVVPFLRQCNGIKYRDQQCLNLQVIILRSNVAYVITKYRFVPV